MKQGSLLVNRVGSSAKGNRLFSFTVSPRIKDVGTALGVKNPGTRALSMRRLAGIAEHYDWEPLGSPELMVSAHRRRIIELRNRYAAAPATRQLT